MAAKWETAHEKRLKALADSIGSALDDNLIDQNNRWGATRAYAEVLRAWSALQPPAAS